MQTVRFGLWPYTKISIINFENWLKNISVIGVFAEFYDSIEDYKLFKAQRILLPMIMLLLHARF